MSAAGVRLDKKMMIQGRGKVWADIRCYGTQRSKTFSSQQLTRQEGRTNDDARWRQRESNRLLLPLPPEPALLLPGTSQGLDPFLPSVLSTSTEVVLGL